MILAATDYGIIGTAVAMALIAFLQVWNARKVNQTAKVVDQTAKVVDQVHALTNSSMGLQKKALAEVTAAKAAITHSKQDEEAAAAAFRDYQEHEARQVNADNPVK